MKRYTVTVNGINYTVDVEEVDLGQEEDQEAFEEKIQLPIDVKPSRVNGKQMIPVLSPLDSEIEEILVKEGDQVSDGQLLALVKVMGIVNEITAPDEGEITTIAVKEGDHVEAGSCIIEIHS